MTDVVVISRAGQDSLPPPAVKALQLGYDVRFIQRAQAPSRAEAELLLGGARVLASTNVTLPVLDDDLLDRLPRLEHIVLYATGYDHLDIDALAARGITVTTLPEYATNAVAEHALALLFACATRLPLAHDRARGTAPAEVSLRGVEITKRTLAIIGLGRIGRRLAQLAGGLGIRVVGVDIDPRACERAAAAGVIVLSLENALAAADLVAVCASTIPGLTPILGPAELARLDPSTFVANVGRPVLIDTDAIRQALLRRRLRGYAVDEVVFDPEDPIDALLLAELRVLQTAHSAWWRDEVLARGSAMFAAAIQAAADGSPVNVVAPRYAPVGAAG